MDKKGKQKLHDGFLKLRDDNAFVPAKITLSDIATRFEDKDGNFVEQFQTNGFEQRLWELLLFAIFESEGFVIKQDHLYPDFELIKNGEIVFVEATTSNIQEGDNTSEELIKIVKSNKPQDEQLAASKKLKELYIEKIGSVLFSKVTKKYHEKDWVKDKPIVIALAPIHDEYARQNSDYLTITYLYGYEFSYVEDNYGNLVKVDYFDKNVFEKRNKTEIEPFFIRDDSKYISAVLFYNELSIDKFNRMGFKNGIENSITIVRECNIYDPDSSKPKNFTYTLGAANELDEDWKQGVSIFHNPNAHYPLKEDYFKGFRQVWFRNKKLVGYMPKNFPFNSKTETFVTK